MQHLPPPPSCFAGPDLNTATPRLLPTLDRSVQDSQDPQGAHFLRNLPDSQVPPEQQCSAAGGLTSLSAEAFTHDARNLLTALGLYADLLAAPGVLSPGHRHYAHEIRLLADRSAALMARVLPSSRPQAEAEEAGVEETLNSAVAKSSCRNRSGEPLCDPGMVLRRFLPLLQAQTSGAAEVVLRLPREIPPLPVSGEALERITANLVCNAAQAIRSAAQVAEAHTAEAPGGSRSVKGAIWIALQARDGVARLSVEDSGPGMPPLAAAVLLHPETDLAWPLRSGRGWGHRIVHGLVTETGGRLAVRPRPAGGTVVTVRWSLASSSAVRFYPEASERSLERTVIAC